MVGTNALVVIDVQNEFMSPKGNFPASEESRTSMTQNLQGLIPKFRSAGGHIIWVQAIYENRTEEPARMRAQCKGEGVVGNNEWLTAATHVYHIPCCEAGSSGAEIHPGIFALASSGDAVVTKGGYSAFWETTALLDALRAKDVTDVYYCGVASGTCVLATVLDTVKLGHFKVNVVPDCMGWRRLNTHEEAMRRYRELGVSIAESNEIRLASEATSSPSSSSFRSFSALSQTSGSSSSISTICSSLSSCSNSTNRHPTL